MRVIVFGSSGMVGQGVLRECLLDDGITEVIAVVRKPTDQRHAKLREVLHADFTNFSSLDVEADACFWCLGVTSAGMSEADYTRITHDYTLDAAQALAHPSMTFVFVSGAGADGTAMWARVKRRTEEDLAPLPWKALYVFRPGLIQPLHGIRSRTRIYNILYPILYPVMLATKVLSAKSITTTERLGRAMIRVARSGFPQKILGNPEINAAAEMT